MIDIAEHIKSINKQDTSILIRVNKNVIKGMRKRAKELDFGMSTYIRAVIFLDMRFKFVERVVTDVSLDMDFLKRVDKVLLAGSNKGTKKKKK